MKYPFFSNWIAYKRIPGQDVYYVKDYVLDTESVVTSEMMTFAKKSDGKIRILLRARETFQRRETDRCTRLYGRYQKSMVLS